MAASMPSLRSINDLREFINGILCAHGELELNAFPLTERVLTRCGTPCGIYFCLHGPRAVRLSAIWDNQRNSVLFYGSSGERFHRVQLIESPKLARSPEQCVPAAA